MEVDLKKDSIRFGRTVIDYQYAFSKRKQLAISVYPDLKVVAIAPDTASLEKVREKVKKRGGWILKQKRFFEQFLPVSKPRKFVSGESHLYLGKQYRLRVRKGKVDQVKLTGGFFYVEMRGEKSPKRVQKLMEQWYLSHAREFFSKQLMHCLLPFSRYEMEKPEFNIRSLKSRWGYCSKFGVLSLNKDLIKTPRQCIQYVITHELCHLIEPNHSPKFYDLLQKTLPNWQIIKDQLNLFGSVVS